MTRPSRQLADEPRTHRRPGLGAALACALALASVFATPASADLQFGSWGSGAGELRRAMALDVDRSTGHVYVGDEDNARVSVFDEDGSFLFAFGWGVADGVTPALQTCTTVCFAGILGSGPGQFTPSDLRSVEIDNDPGSPTFRHVFVGTSRVQRFEPDGTFAAQFNTGTGGGNTNAARDIAIGKEGILYGAAGANLVRKFTTLGAPAGELNLLPEGLGVTTNGIAVNDAGEIYLASGNFTGAVRRYDAAGNLLSTFNPSLNILDIAVDASGNVYVSDSQAAYQVGKQAIFMYEAAGTLLRVFYGERAYRVSGIAPYSSATGEVFIVDDPVLVDNPGTKRVAHVPFPPPGPMVAPETTRSTDVTNVKATLRAAVNPANKTTTHHFEYVDEETFEESGFANALKTPETATGADWDLYAVTAEITGLLPSTTYHFRVVAKNTDAEREGSEATFTTRPPFELEGTWATAVDADAATLHAEVNPLGLPASGYFEYVDDSTYQESGFAQAARVPDVESGEAALDFGESEAPTAHSVTVEGLEPDTTYHYRIVVENPFVEEGGPERALRTFPARIEPNEDCPNQPFRFGASQSLPDCRAYEMVSPVDKNGGDVAAADPKNGVAQLAADGRRMTFTSQTAFAQPKSSKLLNQFLSTRDAQTGWETISITAPSGSVPFYPSGAEASNYQFKAFSEDLCDGWFLQSFDTPLVPGAPQGAPSIYKQSGCGGDPYELITNVAPAGHVLVPGEFTEYMPTVQGFSRDGTRTVFRANAKLTGNAAPGIEAHQLYVYYDDGRLRLVSVRPEGAPHGGFASVGTAIGSIAFNPVTNAEDNVRGAVSANGSRVFWTATEAGKAGPGQLYLRLNATEVQSKLEGGECAEPAKACTIEVSAGSGARFWGADPDGTRAVYTESGSLYEFDVATRTRKLIAPQTAGVMGTSEDARRVYFASKAALDDGAVAGEDNLYLYDSEAESYAFIAALSDLDLTQGEITTVGPGAFALQPSRRMSRIAPDGLHAIFVSFASPTGYDNTDANSGRPDGEVYRYDAAEDRLLCVSCDPSGARPVGRDIHNGVRWAAAVIPGWPSQFQPSRALSDDGSRVFFESFGPLLLSDTNGHTDVYQWEEPGAGDCRPDSPNYFEWNGGCLSLITSGRGGSDSELFDASPDGSTVVIGTYSSLLPQDPGLFDLYAATVEGGYPPPPPPPVPCLGDACQTPAMPPNDPTPASESFHGAGDPRPRRAAGRKRCPRGKRRVVRRGRARCVAKKRAVAKRKRRAQRRAAKRRHRPNRDRREAR